MLADGLAQPPRTPMLQTPQDHGMDYEEITFLATDGVKLNGWFIPADSRRIVICNHFSPANRYGYPGHMEPFNNAGGFEVNFLPKYKALHDAGYNVLAYDMRNHGNSESSPNGICGVGYWEWQDVLGSLNYVRTRTETQSMDIFLQSMCMGGNATLQAMEKHPAAFEGIKSWILIQPLNGQTCIERACEAMGVDVEAGLKEFEPINKEKTGLSFADHFMNPLIKSVKLPTLMLQVRNDMNSRASDIQTMFDDLEMEDKKLIWVEDTPWRFRGYTYFSEHPEEMVAWYDAH